MKTKENPLLYTFQKKKFYPKNPLEAFRKLSFKFNRTQIIKLILVLIIIIIFALLNNIDGIIGSPIPFLESKEDICYQDAITHWLIGVHESFKSSKAFSRILSIFCSIEIDISFILSFFGWALYSIDWRYGVNVMVFYGVRGLIQEFIILREPEDHYFPYPGFPSVVTAYQGVSGSDFFFSGHCGFPILAGIEFGWFGRKYISIFCFLIVPIEIFLMLVSRDHYTIDVIVGPIVAHYVTLLDLEFMNLVYRLKFLKKLRKINREDLKRIGVQYSMEPLYEKDKD